MENAINFFYNSEIRLKGSTKILSLPSYNQTEPYWSSHKQKQQQQQQQSIRNMNSIFPKKIKRDSVLINRQDEFNLTSTK